VSGLFLLPPVSGLFILKGLTMAYTHTNAVKVTCTNDPVDADSTDWIYFSYQNWLRTGETITAHSAIIDGGTIVTASTSLGTVKDSLGVSYTNSYGVEFSVTAGATKVTITHRITTTVSGSPDLGRTNIDHSAVLPVKVL
jgi:hypothetical protein